MDSKYKRNIFDGLLKKYGGILDVEEFTGELVNNISPSAILEYGLEHFRQQVNRWRHEDEGPHPYNGIENIGVYYVNNESINAWAVSERQTGLEFIGLTYMCSLQLKSYFSLLLSTKEFLADIGSSDKEELSISDAILDLQNLTGQHFGKVHPKCEERQKVAFALWHIAMDFLCFHEIGHHVRGHLLLLNNIYGYCEVSEFWTNEYSQNKDFYSLCQLLETDADRWATVASGVFTEKVFSVFGLNEFRLSVNEFRFIAYSILFHIFDESSIDNSLGRSSTHPHPAIRRANILFFIITATAKTQEQFNAGIMQYSHIVDYIELTLSLLAKYPEYKRQVKQKDVNANARTLRLELNELVDNSLLKFMDERNKTILKQGQEGKVI